MRGREEAGHEDTKKTQEIIMLRVSTPLPQDVEELVFKAIGFNVPILHDGLKRFVL